MGFDAHPLVENRPLVLGGVEVPSGKGLAGHSDGDVLVHAIMDALLGAAGLGDKGSHFPSSDPSYKDISSLVLLSRVAELIRGDPPASGEAGPFHCHPERSEGSKVPADRGPILACTALIPTFVSRHFRFLAPLRSVRNDTRRVVDSPGVENQKAPPGRGKAWRIVNIDATMLAQRPMLGPFIKGMKDKISAALSISEGSVSIKATTTDHLGFVGREEGIAAYAVALVEETV